MLLLSDAMPFRIPTFFGYLMLIAGLLVRRARPFRRVIPLVLYLLIQAAGRWRCMGCALARPFTRSGWPLSPTI